MPLLNRKARFALSAAKTGIKTYGATQRARGRAAGRRTAGGGRRGVAMGAALGAGGIYVLDRRHAVIPRAIGFMRRTARAAPNDVTLTRKVESIIFRPADAPKGHGSVNTEHGVVFLRGQVESPDQIRRLVDDAAAVDGVTAVENLLHL